MTLLSRVRSFLRSAIRRSAFERDMDEELRFHLDSYIRDLERSGLTPAEARRRAAIEFGGVALNKDDCRRAIGLRLIDDVAADVRYGVRQLRRSPVFTAVVVLSLGLGIGVNTAMLSLMESALWKSSGVRDPQSVRVFSWVSGPRTIMNSTWGSWARSVKGNRASTSFSFPGYEWLQQHQTMLDAVFAYKPIGRVTAVVDGQAELVEADLVSGNFFIGVGVSPALGRSITAVDDIRGGAQTVAVISDGYWSRRFGRDPAVVGRSIVINQVPVTIVGVNPASFTGVDPAEHPDVFMPLVTQPLVAPWRRSRTGSLLDDPDYWWLMVVGRLKAGVSDSAAQATLESLFQEMVRETLPDRPDRDRPVFRLLAGSRGQDNLREQFGTPLRAMGALAAIVLLIACANVATLLLSRADARQRELGLRLALGAGRGRIARQLLTEGVALGLAGGACGLVLSYWLRDAIPHLLVPSWVAELRFAAVFDWRVLGMALAVTLATSVVFSLAPIGLALRTAVSESLKSGARSVSAAGRMLHGRALVVVQVSLSVVLLVGAGLFARTLWNLQSIEIGIRPDRVVLFTVDPPRATYAGAARRALFERLRQAVAAVPGVESATLSESPLVAGGSSRTRVGPNGREPQQADEAWVDDVGAMFFETLGIPILAGRSFDTRDREASQPVIVVSERFARTFFPGTDATGRIVRNNGVNYTIVGVCGDVRFSSARLPAPPLFYRHFAQSGDPGAMTFAVRNLAGGGAVVNSVRQAVSGVDRNIPLFDIRTQREQVDATMSGERLFTVLTVVFGALALVLASIGIYGTVAHGVVRRTAEIGIRLALGAERRQVLAMILREASTLAVAGAAIGAAAAASLTRYVEALLFGVRPLDPFSLIAAVVVMLTVAVLAGWLPARKASRFDPIAALRRE